MSRPIFIREAPTEEHQATLSGTDLVYSEIERRAFYGLKPGSQGELGKALGISKQAVNQWTLVPAKYVLSVCEVLDLDPERIRPDVFSRDPEKRKAAAKAK